MCPTNATSATPLVRPPESGDVELDGSPVATGVTAPCGPILTMLAVKPPEYGPIGAGTCSQSACVVCIVPPVPPSATYRLPSGPNVSPRGLSSPVAITVPLEPAATPGAASTAATRPATIARTTVERA